MPRSPAIKFLVIGFASIAGIIIIAEQFSPEYSGVISNFVNLAITVPLVVISATIAIRDGIKSDFGKALLCLTIFITLWFVAERIWMMYELVYQTDPWPSEADIFWLAGYPMYFAFAFFYLKPFKKSISFPMIIIVCSLITMLAVFIIYHSSMQEEELDTHNAVLGLIYPVADAFTLIPIILGLILFFRGQVHLLWSCMLIGMLFFVISDYGFFFISQSGDYYSGSYIDIPYLWAYLFFLVGTYDYLKIFRKRGDDRRFNDQSTMR
ncbi:MAG: hypothetical protein QXG67_04340 [Candidatus Nitrosotenuis sp.]